MKLEKLRNAMRNVAGTKIPRQDRTSVFLKAQEKRAGKTGYAGESGEVVGGAAKPRLDRPARAFGGPVKRAEGGLVKPKQPPPPPPVVGSTYAKGGEVRNSKKDDRGPKKVFGGGREEDHEDRTKRTRENEDYEGGDSERDDGAKDAYEHRGVDKHVDHWKKGGPVHRGDGGLNPGHAGESDVEVRQSATDRSQHLRGEQQHHNAEASSNLLQGLGQEALVMMPPRTRMKDMGLIGKTLTGGTALTGAGLIGSGIGHINAARHAKEAADMADESAAGMEHADGGEVVHHVHHFVEHEPHEAHGGPLTTEHRNALPGKDFAGPHRSYPIEDENHARNALSRVSQFGSPEEKHEVREKVHHKYPGIGEE